VDFTSTNWFVPQPVFVRSVQDTTMDRLSNAAQPPFTVSLGTAGNAVIAAGADASYNGLAIVPATINGVNNEDEKYIYVTTTTHDGNFDGDAGLVGLTYGAINGDSNGLAEIDNYCMKPVNGYPGNSNYKAFFVLADYSPSARRASYTANIGDGQIDWILKPNTTYYRPTGIQIMTTNANALYIAWPLSASFDSAASQYWSGMLGDWTFGATCTILTSNAPGVNGDYGTGNLNTVESISNTSFVKACNVALKVACIEQ
jgi:hypothetical protein